MSDDEDCEYEYPSDVDDYDLPSTPYAPASPAAKKQKNLGPPLLPPPPPGGLLRQTSTSYQLVIPRNSYVIRTASEIQPLLDALVDETSRLFAISLDEAQILLQQCKWNKERMIEKFYSNEEKLRKEACLDLFCPDVRCDAKEDVTCRICYDTVSPDQVHALGCRHFFCRDCYGGYLESSVADGPSCVLTHCAEPNCTQRVPKSFFHAVAPDGVAGRFDQYMLKNFIKTSLSMNYCPAPRCDKVSVGSGITTIQCECGFPYCFKCGQEAHDPCSCDQLNKWQLKNSDDSETANWLLTHTKMCPKCKSSTEKNDGCNHMTCKICAHHYCWICMGKSIQI